MLTECELICMLFGLITLTFLVPSGTEAALYLMPGIKLCLCCPWDKLGVVGQRSGLPQAGGNKPEDFEPADSSRGKMKEAAEGGRLRSPSYGWFPAWDTLPSAATSQKHESNFGDALRHTGQIEYSSGKSEGWIGPRVKGSGREGRGTRILLRRGTFSYRPR